MSKKISNQEFQTDVIQSEKKVLVDFFASWCAPCKMLAPVLDEVEKDLDGAQIYKVDIDEEMELAQTYKVMSVPTLITFQDGKEIDRLVGVKPKTEIIKMLA